MTSLTCPNPSRHNDCRVESIPDTSETYPTLKTRNFGPVKYKPTAKVRWAFQKEEKRLVRVSVTLREPVNCFRARARTAVDAGLSFRGRHLAGEAIQDLFAVSSPPAS